MISIVLYLVRCNVSFKQTGNPETPAIEFPGILLGQDMIPDLGYATWHGLWPIPGKVQKRVAYT